MKDPADKPDHLGEFLDKWEQYLDGKLSYEDLPPAMYPRPSTLTELPPPPELVTEGQITAMVDASAHKQALRTAAVVVGIPVTAATVVAMALRVPWYIVLPIQQAVSWLVVASVSRYLSRKGKGKDRPTYAPSSGDRPDSASLPHQETVK